MPLMDVGNLAVDRAPDKCHGKPNCCAGQEDRNCTLLLVGKVEQGRKGAEELARPREAEPGRV